MNAAAKYAMLPIRMKVFCFEAKYTPALPACSRFAAVTETWRAALSIMKTPKINSPYITSTSTQFIPRIFLKNGVIAGSSATIGTRSPVARRASTFAVKAPCLGQHHG